MTTRTSTVIATELFAAEEAASAAFKVACAAEAKLRKARGSYVTHHRNYNEASRAWDASLEKVEGLRKELEAAVAAEALAALPVEPTQVELF